MGLILVFGLLLFSELNPANFVTYFNTNDETATSIYDENHFHLKSLKVLKGYKGPAVAKASRNSVVCARTSFSRKILTGQTFLPQTPVPRSEAIKFGDYLEVGRDMYNKRYMMDKRAGSIEQNGFSTSFALSSTSG